jgi:hypothetical protein
MESLVFSKVIPYVTTTVAAKTGSTIGAGNRRVRGLSASSERALPGPPIKKGALANTRSNYFPLVVISSSSFWLLSWCE